MFGGGSRGGGRKKGDLFVRVRNSGRTDVQWSCRSMYVCTFGGCLIIVMSCLILVFHCHLLSL